MLCRPLVHIVGLCQILSKSQSLAFRTRTPQPQAMTRPIRLAVRALILRDQRLLLVNAYRGGQSDLWCAPGGGAELHQSLPENLCREVFEETGLRVEVGSPVLVNEFHVPDNDFHQVDIYFRCNAQNDLPETWVDPEGIVSERKFFSQAELHNIRFKPDSLPDVAWDLGTKITYDPLEPLVR